MKTTRAHTLAPLSRWIMRRGFTLYELLALILAAAVLLAVVSVVQSSLRASKMPTAGRKRAWCGANLRGIWYALTIYENENRGSPVPNFDESRIGDIRYTVPPGGGQGTRLSPSRTQASIGGEGGAVELSTTRAFWTLVRQGNITTQQFVCPATGEKPEEVEGIESYYDFGGFQRVSYGFHVPFGPQQTRLPRAGADNRHVLAADKGPYVDANVTAPPVGLSEASPPKEWMPYNSRNHSGFGQNVLFADGHVSFERTPIVGVDHDNIYTAALDNVNASSRIRGESPWVRNAHPFAPRDAEGKPIASTDTLIYP